MQGAERRRATQRRRVEIGGHCIFGGYTGLLLAFWISSYKLTIQTLPNFNFSSIFIIIFFVVVRLSSIFSTITFQAVHTIIIIDQAHFVACLAEVLTARIAESHFNNTILIEATPQITHETPAEISIMRGMTLLTLPLPCTALYLASDKHNWDVVSILLENGADATIATTENEETILEHAIDYGMPCHCGGVRFVG